MAAYAALVSLMNLLEQLQRHPQPPITLNNNQVQTLTQKIAFLQEFLEFYNSHYSKPEMEHLRNHIADVAHAAEDVIETHIVDRVHAQHKGGIIASLQNLFVEADKENSGSIDLHEVIRDMSIVEKEVLEIKDTLGTQDPQRFITTDLDLAASKSTSKEHNIMVGFGDVLEEMLHKLTGQPDSSREIIPISGMGGIGKTTLAQNVYINPLTEYYFDIRAWITISQEYNMQDILLGLLGEKNQGSRESKSEAEVGDRLYKSLFGRRYLVVMDDMWSPEPWDRVKRFFPNECNGSRIIITTRLTNLASNLTTNCCDVEMDFLDNDRSWSLFCKIVFGEEDGCPSELEHVGKEISRNCKGLPLSIVVIGGLLAKSKRTHEYWEYIAENLNSIVNLEENERCFKILRTSYYQLPAHLKACFLYIGSFPEDREIIESELIRMCVAESFLKPINGKGLEESVEEYLMDLVSRNLIMVHEKEFPWGEKVFNIHDLLRDLCIREGRKENFICVANRHSEGLSAQRRIAIHQYTSKKECLDNLKGGSTTRSLICNSLDVLPLAQLKLLRVLTMLNTEYEKEIGNYFRLVNLRYFSLLSTGRFKFPTSFPQLWNLQTIYVSGGDVVVAPPEIWKLPLIRHIQTNGSLILPDPPIAHTDGQDDFVLRELRTLVTIRNLKLGEKVIKRIPNVTKLALTYSGDCEGPLVINNLNRLYKLEDFSLIIFYPQTPTELLQNLTFPHSLKKLSLSGIKLHWEDVSAKIGSLPRLQMLNLGYLSVIGPEWNTVEGQFCNLKYLRIAHCNLKCWITESTHFPCLEYLHLVVLHNLEEIPLCIGDIPTLKSIIVEYCSDSVIISAKRILDEQEEFGNLHLRVRITLRRWNDKSLEKLAAHNFQFQKSVSY